MYAEQSCNDACTEEVNMNRNTQYRLCGLVSVYRCIYGISVGVRVCNVPFLVGCGQYILRMLVGSCLLISSFTLSLPLMLSPRLRSLSFTKCKFPNEPSIRYYTLQLHKYSFFSK